MTTEQKEPLIHPRLPGNREPVMRITADNGSYMYPKFKKVGDKGWTISRPDFVKAFLKMNEKPTQSSK